MDQAAGSRPFRYRAGWIEQGHRLAQRLLSELGVGYEVVYFNEATEEEEAVQSATG